MSVEFKSLKFAEGQEFRNGVLIPEDGNSKLPTTNIMFSLDDEVGALAEALNIFKESKINLHRIESRTAKKSDDSFEFLVECCAGAEEITEAVSKLRSISTNLKVILKNHNGKIDAVPWFPCTIQELDKCSNKILATGSSLDTDHPGFSDQEYIKRRNYFANLSYSYKQGEPIPRVQYTDEEIKTWGIVMKELKKLYPTHACREHNDIFPVMIEECGYREDNIPQLEDVSNFLKSRTGFTLRPAAGYLNPRDFLAGLAFRVFNAVIFVRHSSRPFYTPEPDICHELLGHAPLFADPSFAKFSQEIGLASLGAPDDYIEQLSTVYWFTIEFGLCKQNGKVFAYGAALLSSFGELEYCLSGKPEIRDFNLYETACQKYPFVEYQPLYYLAESFVEAQQKVLEFALSIPRPFTVHYNAYTLSIEILDTKPRIEELAKDIISDIQILADALKKF